MITFYFTFGFAHVHHIEGKTLDKDCWVEISATSGVAARQKMQEIFGQQWSQQYGSREFEPSYFPDGCKLTLEA